ncbi:MAG: siderophore-interacting protein [Gammaproteobacteria bacterium]|nr:siderophore-interacting protein [Gammaproteobacteria bacterium]
MAKAPREVHVHTKEPLTPNLTRVVLAGEALDDFPTGFEGGYVKLVLDESGDKPLVRSYTVRSFDPDERTLTLEMVSHGDGGPAAIWANNVSEGDTITITGPGACQPINTEADWFLLAGDMSALPAIRVNLERLPDDAEGHVVLEIITEADKVDLTVPPGMEVDWVVNPEPEQDNSVLEDTVMALPWRDGAASVWVAGEFSASRALRQYFRHQKQIPRELMYVSCYWKIGTTDEGMKAAKREDPEPW